VTADWIRVIEAAYTPASTDAGWLRGVHDAVLPLLDRGLGIAVELFDLDASKPRRGGYQLAVRHHDNGDRG
jgi:hypothetical protein